VVQRELRSAVWLGRIGANCANRSFDARVLFSAVCATSTLFASRCHQNLYAGNNIPGNSVLPTNDITRCVLYDDGRFGVLWPVILRRSSIILRACSIAAASFGNITPSGSSISVRRIQYEPDTARHAWSQSMARKGSPYHRSGGNRRRHRVCDRRVWLGRIGAN
jgi:hypothetical protein